MIVRDVKAKNSMSSTPSIPDSNSYNWVIVPATRCVQAVAEGARLSGLLQRAVGALANQESLLIKIEAFLKLAGKDVHESDVALDEKNSWTTWAKDLLAGGLHEVHAPGIIALWATLEVAVEDTATLILINDGQAVINAVQAGLKIPSKWLQPFDETTARRAFARFEQVARESRSIADAYAYILQVLGVKVSVQSTVLEKLSELNYVRNCILHRGGIVDGRGSVEAPRLALCTGDSIRVTKETYLEYFSAVGEFAQQILEATIKSRHARWKS